MRRVRILWVTPGMCTGCNALHIVQSILLMWCRDLMTNGQAMPRLTLPYIIQLPLPLQADRPCMTKTMLAWLRDVLGRASLLANATGVRWSHRECEEAKLTCGETQGLLPPRPGLA